MLRTATTTNTNQQEELLRRILTGAHSELLILLLYGACIRIRCRRLVPHEITARIVLVHLQLHTNAMQTDTRKGQRVGACTTTAINSTSYCCIYAMSYAVDNLEQHRTHMHRSRGYIRLTGHHERVHLEWRRQEDPGWYCFRTMQCTVPFQ